MMQSKSAQHPHKRLVLAMLLNDIAKKTKREATGTRKLNPLPGP
jgi:hypothetical protein